MLFLPDGFTTTAIFDKSQGGTTNANGAYFTVAGVGIDQYVGKAKTFINGFKKQYNIKDVQPYAILAAQAAQVLLDAIEKSDGSRAQVITNVFGTHVTDGLIGSFSFNKNGDLSGATGPSLEFTVYDGKNNTLQPSRRRRLQPTSSRRRGEQAPPPASHISIIEGGASRPSLSFLGILRSRPKPT